MGQGVATVVAAILDLSPSTVEVLERGLSPTVVEVIELHDWGEGADLGF